jgi:amino acid transporter
MFAYGGWNDMPLIAAEVRNPNQNLSRSLILGTVGIAVVYLLVNLAFVHLLGFEGVRNSAAVGAEAMEIVLGSFGEVAFSLLVAVSCLGANQGMLFTGARIFYATGSEHQLFRWLGKWDARSQSPRRSWILQSFVTLLITGAVGLQSGEEGFQRAVAISAAPFWFFIMLAILALPVLRLREPQRERPYHVPLFPLIPLVFFAACALMLYSSAEYAGNVAPRESLVALAVIGLGAIVGHYSCKSK